MTKGHTFPLVRQAFVPVIFGHDSADAIAAARALAQEVVLVGLVRVPPGEPVSAGVAQARQVRQQLRTLTHGSDPGVRAKAVVHVSYTPWKELHATLEADEPDLLVLDWAGHLEALALGVSAAEVLARPVCDVVLVRGPFPEVTRRVLLPMRGGPHAELALRLGLSLRPDH